MESSTVGFIDLCRFDNPIKVRVCVSDFQSIERHPLWRTVNLKKIERENRNLRLNIEAGNSEPCRCQRCNPDTSNG